MPRVTFKQSLSLTSKIELVVGAFRETNLKPNQQLKRCKRLTTIPNSQMDQVGQT